MAHPAAQQTAETSGHERQAPATTSVDARALSAFEDRYGDGSFVRLAQWLEQPCVTFAQIATRFGVSRELVRQWHRRFRPGAPSGHERQRLCALYQQRRRLFEDELFRGFFRHARDRFGPRDIEPIRSRSGYRARTVRIDGRLVALRDLASPADTGASTVRYRGRAPFLYLRLGEDDFLFVPAAALASRGIRISDAAARLSRFRNSFAAFAGRANAAGAAQTMPLPQDSAPALSENERE